MIEFLLATLAVWSIGFVLGVFFGWKKFDKDFNGKP